MTAPRPVRAAAVDIGTVTTRLILAERQGGAVREVARCGFVTDLGEGVDAAGMFAPAAVERVTGACRAFAQDIAAFKPDTVLTVLTSAARDASNADTLLDNLRALGFDPQIISGKTEARIMFAGVAADFPGERIAVADSGGGSTEIAIGAGAAAGGEGAECALDRSQSLDIGCCRVTERFLGADGAGVDAARQWMRVQFLAFWDAVANRPERLVAVGGTVTTLVAVRHALVPYDSSFVHLHGLTLLEVEELSRRFAGLTVEEIAGLPGIEPKRAPVIYAGALIVAELMRAGDYDRLTVSENGLLAGLAHEALACAAR